MSKLDGSHFEALPKGSWRAYKRSANTTAVPAAIASSADKLWVSAVEGRQKTRAAAYALTSNGSVESKPGIHSNHLRRHNHQPRDSQRNPQSYNELRHHGGVQHAVDHLHLGEPEVAPGVEMDGGDIADGVHGGNRHGEE